MREADPSTNTSSYDPLGITQPTPPSTPSRAEHRATNEPDFGPGRQPSGAFFSTLFGSSTTVPVPEPRTIVTTTAEHEMERVISGISSSRARTDPSACINALNPLIDTVEGRRFLLKQEGEKALMLIELFDWVVIALFLYVFTTRTENVACQALKSRGIRLDKGCVLWTLRQLCACKETLPESYVLPIEFKSTNPYHAAGGFADVWKGTYEEREVAFKSIRGSTLSDDAARLRRRVRDNVLL